MYRYKIVIEYDGTEIHGWQKQENVISIQEILERAIFSFTGQNILVYGSGRTDAGVHAKGQVAHFDLNKLYNTKEVISAINYWVRPYRVMVIECNIVSKEFHARYSAKKRHYMYLVINREFGLCLDKNRAYWVKKYLNVDKMQKAANFLIGTYDFTSFRSSSCAAKSPIKTIDRLDIKKDGDNIKFYISATSFLHHMVRNIVGTLIQVGSLTIKEERVKEILELKNRTKAGPTAKASGLYLTKVDY